MQGIIERDLRRQVSCTVSGSDTVASHHERRLSRFTIFAWHSAQTSIHNSHGIFNPSILFTLICLRFCIYCGAAHVQFVYIFEHTSRHISPQFLAASQILPDIPFSPRYHAGRANPTAYASTHAIQVSHFIDSELATPGVGSVGPVMPAGEPCVGVAAALLDVSPPPPPLVDDGSPDSTGIACVE